MKSVIRKILYEEIKNNKVICDNCGWTWDLSDGGDDPYTCHKCGHENSQKKSTSNFRKILEKLGGGLPNQEKNLDYLENFVKTYIAKNNFTVKFLPACLSYAGVRTRNQIIICAPSEMSSLGDFLYTVFHEMRHEQQISQIKMDNPLTDYDLDDFEKLYNQYWEMELDADQFAKNMLAQLVLRLNIPLESAKKYFRYSEYIKNYTKQNEIIRGLLGRLIETIKGMRKQGIEYNDIQDHPMVKPMLSKLEDFI